jgi:zinc and cadmium transporter
MTLVLYCLAIAVFSLLGGYLPLSKRISHLNLQVYLSLSGGAMLGAAFFHMLPESAESAGASFGTWMAIGVIGLFMIERFLSPHSHESAGGHEHHHEPVHDHDHDHTEAEQPHARPVRPAAPQVAGWSAVAGLSVHTLIGGVALASSVLGQQAKDLGLAVFLATLLHKPADALTISTLLVKGGTSRQRALMVQGFFSLLIPLGALLFYLGKSVLPAQVDNTFTGCALAFSAGTFVCIALSDLLPEVQFHSHDRGRLFLAVILGAGLMWATSLFESSHSGGGHNGHGSGLSEGAAQSERR